MAQQVVSIHQVAGELAQPWRHAILGQVDDYCAYLCRFHGSYRFHQHHKDEMYLVLQGTVWIEYEDGPTLLLAARGQPGRPGRFPASVRRERRGAGIDVQGPRSLCRVRKLRTLLMENNPVKICDTILRDAHQSLLATRMRTEDMLPIVAQHGPGRFLVGRKCGAGRPLTSAMRFLGENPWDRVRRLRGVDAQHSLSDAAALAERGRL